MLETEISTEEVKKLLSKETILECFKEAGDFVSTVFTREKKDVTFRAILNLKYLNDFVQYQHFKMESLLDVFRIIKPNAWMANVDIKDGFFTVPIHESYQKYFNFEWKDKVYKSVEMQNGYSDAKMTITVSKDKMIAITKKIKKLMATTFPATRQLASVIGSVISLFPAVPLGKLHYRTLEKDKIVALKKASGNFDKIVSKISVKASDELNWWLTEIPHARRNMHLPNIDFKIHADAS